MIETSTSALAVLPTTDLQAELRQYCFEIWLWRADRSLEKMYPILVTEFQTGEDPFLSQFDHLPTLRTVYNWRKVHNWDAEANSLLKSMAKIHMESIYSMFLHRGQDAARTLFDIADGKYLTHKSPGQVAIMQKAAREIVQVIGVGTDGAVGGQKLEIEVKAPASLEGKTTLQLAQEQRDMIAEERQQKRLTGRSSNASR